MPYSYTRKDGLFTAKTHWGEVITAHRKDILDHLMVTAERREKQRQTLVRRMHVDNRRKLDAAVRTFR